tara:strand:- start:1647 stop:2789 length:1143 start_codon:yes stop_codon:yes gene_type:complete
MNNIQVIGLGYIGFPLACLLAKKRKIICVDVDKSKILNLKKKKLPFKEKELKNLFNKNFKNLFFEQNITQEKKVSTYIICVPTPLKNNKAELKYLYNVMEELKKILKKNDLVIIESTIPPGTTQKIYKKYDFYKKKINLAYCPERAIPGNTLFEMQNNYRIIGGINPSSSLKAKKIYKLFCKKSLITNSIEAEISKLAENTHRLVNISLTNEINELCKNYGVQSKNLFKITNLHPRVNYLKPGIGIGGHCIPIDPLFLNQKKQIQLIDTSIIVDNQFTSKIVKSIFSKIKNKKKDKILCLGATYKENVDDLRESAAIKIIDKLKKNIKNIHIYDPLNKSLNNINEKKLKNYKFDLVIYLVNHDKFKNIKIKSTRILDYRY